MTTDTITDEELVAFLDGVSPDDLSARIEQALADGSIDTARLESLHLDTGKLRNGFDAVLDQAPALHPPSTATGHDRVLVGWRAAVAAAVVFGAGLAAGWAIKPPPLGPNWHQAVADYQALYATATLANLPMEADLRALSLQRTTEDLGLPLTTEQVAIEGLRFQRAQILAFDGQPLAQLTYLDRDGRPVAFCLMRTDGDAPALSQRLNGLNAVTWAEGGMGFILIGPVEPETLSNAQKALARKIML